MSFDVFLQRFASGNGAAVDRQAVLQVRRTTTYTGPDDFGFYHVTFPDGVSVEFSARGLESSKPFEGCAFHIRGFGNDLARYIFDVARAGDMVIIPGDGSPLILVADAQLPHVPVEMRENPRPVVAHTATELGEHLRVGVSAWEV